MAENGNDYKFGEDQPKPRALRWDGSVTWGNIGCIITIIFAGGIIYEKLSEHDKQIISINQSVGTLNSTLVDTNLLVRELATTVRVEGNRTRMENRQDR